MQNGNLPAKSSSNLPTKSPSGPETGSLAAPVADSSLDLSGILDTLKREKLLILVVCLVITGLVAGYTYTLPPVYQASSLVKIDRENPGAQSITGGMMSGVSVGQTEDLSGEIGVLQNSIELARRVTQKLQATEEAGGDTKTFPVLTAEGPEADSSELAIARKILDKVEFVPQTDRNMIEVTVESRDPEEASTIANLYVQEYKKFSQEKARASVKAARTFLKEQADKQQEKIQQLDQRWESFARQNQLVERGAGGEQLASRFNELKARRDQLAFELKKNRTQIELLRQQLRQFQPELEESMARQQAASGLQSEIQALEQKIAQMRAEAATYYAANPDLEGDTTRIQNDFPDLARLREQTQVLEQRKQELTQQLVAKTSGVEEAATGSGAPLERIAQLRSQITEKELTASQLESQISALDSQVAEYESQINTIPEQQIQRKQLERRLNQAKAFHETIMGELQRIAIAEESELGYVEVVRSAFVPGAPVRPNMMQNVILGLLLGLGFGIGGAFLKEAMNTQLRHPEDIEAKGYTLLGVIPTMNPEIQEAFDGHDFIELEGHRVSTRLMPLLNPWSSITENYRLIQTNLKNAEEEEPHTLVITSAMEKEGKTVTSVNMALTGALSSQRVLLIDADMRKPSAHDMIGMPRSPGLADVLSTMPRTNGQSSGFTDPPSPKTNDLSADSYIHRTPIDGLYFIPAGMTESAPSKMLDSGRFQQLVESTQEHFDLVVIDTPPTQAASDSVVIGSQIESKILVVSADESDSRALESAMGALRTVGADVAGVVLNQYAEDKVGKDNGYDYSYYRAEDYYEYREEDEPEMA